MPHPIRFIKTKLDNRKQIRLLQEVNESVIGYLLLSKLRQSENGRAILTSVIYDDFLKSNIAYLGKDGVVSQLLILQEFGYITLKSRTGFIDIEQYSLPVQLNRPILTYFKDKKSEKAIERKSAFRFWLPVIISAIALFISGVTLILNLQMTLSMPS